MLCCLASAARVDAKRAGCSPSSTGSLSCAPWCCRVAARPAHPLTLSHSTPVPGVQADPPAVLWVLATFASTFCHLPLQGPSWCLLCPDRGALHHSASCPCGLTNPHLSGCSGPNTAPTCTVGALCRSRKISKAQSQRQASFSPDIWELRDLSLLVTWVSPAAGSRFPLAPGACVSLLCRQAELVHAQWLCATLVPATPVGATLVPATPVGATLVPATPVGVTLVPATPVPATPVPAMPVMPWSAVALPRSPLQMT